MSALLAALYSYELASLEHDRQAHSLAVGQKVAGPAHLVPPALRVDLLAAAVLHDVGYGHP